MAGEAKPVELDPLESGDQLWIQLLHVLLPLSMAGLAVGSHPYVGIGREGVTAVNRVGHRVGHLVVALDARRVDDRRLLGRRRPTHPRQGGEQASLGFDEGEEKQD